MKFYSVALLIAAWTSGASAFSAVAPESSKISTNGSPSLDAVDKTMQGIDNDSAFDPTAGDSPAVGRNNKDEVWVSQVRQVND